MPDEDFHSPYQAHFQMHEVCRHKHYHKSLPTNHNGYRQPSTRRNHTIIIIRSDYVFLIGSNILKYHDHPYLHHSSCPIIDNGIHHNPRIAPSELTPG